jgi:cytochrome c-type biogenesis protein CcmF
MSSTPFSPIALVGTISLLAAFVVAAWCVAAGIAGNARKSRRLVNSAVYGLWAFTGLVGLAGAMMIYAFVTHDYTIKYVAATSDTTMPTWYKITSFWGGLDGSLLFWVVMLALFAAIAVLANHRRHRDMIGYVVATIMVVQVFFLALLIFTKNPFTTYVTTPPIDGQGLNPLLQNYWMVIHPPSLYTGFVAATIPFAFAIGALASGRLDDMWLGSVRVWMMICFFFLSFGLILGGRWAYEELGWGGYWAWDPVENAGLMPWFTATAFLHSAIIQEQRGMMKAWNLVLVILTFFLTIFGTFMTRSGAVQSVHAFGEDNVLALQFIVFMALIVIVAVGLLIFRANKLSTKTDFESFYSREFAFLINNWILLGCAFFVLFATMFPTISEALDGSRVSVGPEFFNKWMTPLGLILLFLAGAAPLLAWRRTTRERLRDQFLFPIGLTVVTVIGLRVGLPQTAHNSALFADGLQLPVSLINFGMVAFCCASIAQEFYRGVVVRRRQTGSDPITSLIGLTLSKRRKYGGYVIHLGIAVLFVGFGGKAYDKMNDRTLNEPVTMIEDRGPAKAPPAGEHRGLALTSSLSEQELRDDVGLAAPVARAIAGRGGVKTVAELFGVPGAGARVLAALDKYAAAPHTVEWRAPATSLLQSPDGARQVLDDNGVDPKRSSVKLADGAVIIRAEYQLDSELQLRIRGALAERAGLKKDQQDAVKLTATPSGWFEFNGYRFTYEALTQTSDDHKIEYTAQVGIWQDGELLSTVYPAKWDYMKGEQASTEVAIKVRFNEDVYLVLTGFNLESGLANFRVYINPLINWVWIGFMIFAFGTFICLIPQGVVDRLSPRPRTRLGRAADVAVLVLIALGLTAGLVRTAHAAGGAGAAEHQVSGGMGDEGTGYASQYRPDTDTAAKLMKELVCMCGGCQRENIFECKCANAAEARRKVLGLLASYDLKSADGQQKAYDGVVATFIKEYGGEQVLATPRNKASWLLPSLAVVGGLGLLIVAGRRWVKTGQRRVAGMAGAGGAAAVEDEAYADKLDDELSETD